MKSRTFGTNNKYYKYNKISAFEQKLKQTYIQGTSSSENKVFP